MRWRGGGGRRGRGGQYSRLVGEGRRTGRGSGAGDDYEQAVESETLEVGVAREEAAGLDLRVGGDVLVGDGTGGSRSAGGAFAPDAAGADRDVQRYRAELEVGGAEEGLEGGVVGKERADLGDDYVADQQGAGLAGGLERGAGGGDEFGIGE